VVRVNLAAYPKQTFEAKISAINPKVEDTTRNVLVRATLPNPDGTLLPGMFANLQVLLPGESSRVVVPESAITYTLYGNSVYVVGPKKDADGKPEKDDKGEPVLTADRRFIDTGERRNGLAVINNGLKAGEQVVSAGQLKLSAGANVAISIDKTLQADQNSPPRAD
jgi:membrane fusion protein (multidrug efflux system)